MIHTQMATRGPAPSVTDDELIAAIRSRSEPFATAGDVAEIVSLSSERTRQRLNSLAEADRIGRAKVGGSAVVYWLSESGE
jgi:predicted ArsR family transcriptional regulator